MKYIDVGRGKIVLEQEEGPTIQFNRESLLWAQYQEWLNAGNTPEVRVNVLFGEVS